MLRNNPRHLQQLPIRLLIPRPQIDPPPSLRLPFLKRPLLPLRLRNLIPTTPPNLQRINLKAILPALISPTGQARRMERPAALSKMCEDAEFQRVVEMERDGCEAEFGVVAADVVRGGLVRHGGAEAQAGGVRGRAVEVDVVCAVWRGGEDVVGGGELEEDGA